MIRLVPNVTRIDLEMTLCPPRPGLGPPPFPHSLVLDNCTCFIITGDHYQKSVLDTRYKQA